MSTIKIEKEIADIVKTMSRSKIVMPDGWSDEKQLETAPISYKTYNSGSGNYLEVDLVIDGTEYRLQVIYGKVRIEEPLCKHLTPSRLFEIINTIYTEAISPQSIIEGRANLRSKIAKAKKEISDNKIKLAQLENALSGEETEL